MRALSLWQPWAQLLVSGAKRVETRGRTLPTSFRGPLLIHAAKRWDADSAWIAASPIFRAALEAAGIAFAGYRDPEKAARAGWGMPFGAIIGCVNVIACYPTEVVSVGAADDPLETTDTLHIGGREALFGDYSPGRSAFVCSHPLRLEEAIPYRGMQGLFWVPDHLVPALVERT